MWLLGRRWDWPRLAVVAWRSGVYSRYSEFPPQPPISPLPQQPTLSFGSTLKTLLSLYPRLWDKHFGEIGEFADQIPQPNRGESRERLIFRSLLASCGGSVSPARRAEGVCAWVGGCGESVVFPRPPCASLQSFMNLTLSAVEKGAQERPGSVF